MVFRQCSIGGKVYKGETDPEAEQEIAPEQEIVPVEVKPPLPSTAAEKSFEGASTSEAGQSKPEEGASSSSATEVPSPLAAGQVKLAQGVLQHFQDSQLKQDLQDAINPDSGGEGMARTLNGFFVVLALCHTVLTSIDPETQAIEYKAQSPDEAALVQAAADVGFVFRGRDKEILSLQTPFSEELEKYELLNILEFTSARKRMSVVLRRMDVEDGRLFLLTKGADNVIFERLKAGGEDLKQETEKHLDDFASEGLRTLTLAYKVIPGTWYTDTSPFKCSQW